MLITDSCEKALARWFAHGVTSHTHPVLGFALRTFFQPLGIEAELLEAEPFSGVESGSGGWWLNNPRWSAAGVDRARGFAPDFGYLVESPSSFDVSVSTQGAMMVAPSSRMQSDLAARAYWDTSEQGWLAARHSFEAARNVEVFLYAAAALLLNNEPVTTLYALGHDADFCASVLGHIPAP